MESDKDFFDNHYSKLAEEEEKFLEEALTRYENTDDENKEIFMK
jgi:hypothetical protein